MGVIALALCPTSKTFVHVYIKLPTIKKCQPSPPVETEQLQKKVSGGV